MSQTDPVNRLIAEFAKLPGVGEKTAMRLAYFVLRSDARDIQQLTEALTAAKERVRFCEECFTFTELSPCQICTSPTRNKSIVCVIEKPADLMAIENSQRFSGQYHVLHGVLSPLDGIGPDQLRIRELIGRITRHQIQEVILALNPSVEGEATGVYLTKLLSPLGVNVTKIAHGIPVGAVLEYTDRQTIGRALENRITSKLN